MTPGLSGALSGATTNSYLRLREGLNYLCHEAVGNPAETPSDFETLAYTLLGPIFKDQLTAEHIQRFTEAIHETRDKFWQQGGIPKDKRKEALATMKEVFTGAGLEVLMIDMGLNPGAINFHEINGLTGKIGNLGASEKIQKEQDGYHKALIERLPKYIEEGLISKERAEWVKEGIDAMKAGKAPTTLAPEQREVETPAQPDVPDAHMSTTEQPKRNALAEKSQHNHIERLIDKADDKGDWRTQIHLEQPSKTPALMGG